MELDDLKTALQTLDRRLDAQATLNLHVLKEGKLDKLRKGLRPLFWGQVTQILFGGALIVFSASFWTQHSDVPHLLIAGAGMHAYGIMTVIFAGITLGKISRIDYAAPVLEIQKQLAKLRYVYVLNGLCVGLPWWVLWITFMQMFFMSAFGADLYANLRGWVWGSYAVGALGLFATWWFHRWSRDPRRADVAKFVDDGVTGSSLKRAQRFLEEIAEFERG
jgi:hypothetical protein